MSQGFDLETLDAVSRSGAAVSRPVANDDIYLNVIVNGVMKKDMFAFRQKDDDSFITRASDLEEIGFLPDKKAIIQKHWVDLAALPNVTYSYDAEEDAIEFFFTDESALAPYRINIGPANAMTRIKNDEMEEDEKEGAPRSDLAAVLNYDLYADSGADNIKDAFDFSSVSSGLNGRLSGRFGTLNHNQVLTYARKDDDVYNTVRLDSYWSYSDADRLITYRAGDITTRSLPWGRSVRLGGVQIRRNFGLRSDLITTPLLDLSGSAAVPSAVDLYINNAKRVTENVPAGPFALTNMPIITGGNTARLVVRDVQGRETVKEVSFFGGNDMLGKGFLDFSFEAGMPRLFYGSKSNDYDKRLFVSGTARYGLSNSLTLEGHVEIGPDLYNGGMGSIFTLGNLGALSLSGSASQHKGESGQQIMAGFNTQRNGFSFVARTQRSFGYYNDIGSAVSRTMTELDAERNPMSDDLPLADYSVGSLRPAKTINQILVGVPLKFDPVSINFAYTEMDNWYEKNRYASVSMSRNFGSKLYGYVTAFKSLGDNESYSIFAGLSYSFDTHYSASVSADNSQDGTNITSEFSRQIGSKIGDYGWSLSDTEGNTVRRGASGIYRASFGTFSGSVDQYSDSYRTTAGLEGAVVFAGGGILPSNRINDSFAVVDVGAPDVQINYQNSYYGKTGRSGKLVVPNLTAYRENRLSIDMATMPLDTMVTETEAVVVPAYESAVVQKFGGAVESDYAYLSFKDEEGAFIELGSYASISGTDKGFDIAYDGMGLVQTKGLKFPLNIVIERPGGRFCQAVVKSTSKGRISTGAEVIPCVTAASAE